MKIIEMQTPEIWKQKPGFVGMCEHIARCAAVCYDSVPKEGGAAVDFVKSLAERGHGRPLEFGYVWCVTHGEIQQRTWNAICGDDTLTNVRELLHAGFDWDFIESWADESSLLFMPFTIHYPALSRGIADELRTHITLSSLMRSTRYVDAGKGGEVEFVKPYWFKDDDTAENETFKCSLIEAELNYKALLNLGRKRQEAREVLPLCAKTELVQCGFRDAWSNLIKQRDSEAAHPDARWLAQQIKELLLNLGENDEEVTGI